MDSVPTESTASLGQMLVCVFGLNSRSETAAQKIRQLIGSNIEEAATLFASSCVILQTKPAVLSAVILG